jgi:hypothetical protein
MAGIVIVPVIVLGLALAILELIFVHQDESGMGWLKHGIHAVPTMLIFIFISMNIPYVESLLKWKASIWITIGIRVLIGIIAAAKISAAAAVAGRVGEKLPHTLIIAGLIMVAPFAWEIVACTLPFIKNLPMNGCALPIK